MLYTTPDFSDNCQSILIVDDDDMIVELLSVGFEQFGFQVCNAANGLEAWRRFNREHFDVVLTDIQMPVMSGSELCRRIRKQSPSTVLAVMSGGNPDFASSLLNDGDADYFFQKPFDIIKICKVLLAETTVA